MFAGDLVHDFGVVPVPREEANYAARFQKTWRSGLKPIEVVQPEGPSFTVDGWGVEGCGWSFRVGFTPREGLVLPALNIRDGARRSNHAVQLERPMVSCLESLGGL
jgi:primary-amine oxidase